MDILKFKAKGNSSSDYTFNTVLPIDTPPNVIYKHILELIQSDPKYNLYIVVQLTDFNLHTIDTVLLDKLSNIKYIVQPSYIVIYNGAAPKEEYKLEEVPAVGPSILSYYDQLYGSFFQIHDHPTLNNVNHQRTIYTIQCDRCMDSWLL